MALLFKQFVENLTTSGVLSDAELAAAVASLPGDGRRDARALAEGLVRSGKLTRFQAKLLYQGRTHSLVVRDYLVLERIGKGGMGQVFKARHTNLDRTVALKFLDRQLARNSEFVARFLREMRAVAKLSHPNIVHADDAGRHRGRLYLAMEYIHGTDLRDLLKSQGPVDVPQAVNFVIQAARGLEYAHQQGVVHRDIKPANLVLDRNGTVKILDFGLATLEQSTGTSHLTSTGEVMGSIDFMSPEQLSDTRNADQRSDIYALGCVLYFLLTGKPVYGGQRTVTKLVGHMHADVPSLRLEIPGAPERLDQIFQRMLAKEPDERYQSMSEVLQDLTSFASTFDPVRAASGTMTIMDTDRASQADDTSRTAQQQTATQRETRGDGRLDSKKRRGRWKPSAATWVMLSLVGLVVGGVIVSIWRPDSNNRNPIEVDGGTDDAPGGVTGRTPEGAAAGPTGPQSDERVLQVFVLAGQSNMGGPCPIADLDSLTQEQPEAFGHLKTAEGAWVEREDVWIHSTTPFHSGSGALSVGFGQNDDQFGPELGFGLVVGDALDEPVLIIKFVHGFLSLAELGRPPSSGGEPGIYYQDLVSRVDAILENREKWFPALAGYRCQVSGLVWFQGWNDFEKSEFIDEYADNLQNLIRDLRAAWDVPQMPVVIGEFGQHGVIDSTARHGPASREARALRIRAAQRAVAELPEFQGNVRLVETSNYDSDAAGRIHHYFDSAEAFYGFGDAFGRAMLELLDPESRNN